MVDKVPYILTWTEGPRELLSSLGVRVVVVVCRRLSSVNFSSKIFSSETTGRIATKLGQYGPWYI